jgi:hypothetical protein
LEGKDNQILISYFLHLLLVFENVEVAPSSLVELLDDIGLGNDLSFYCLLKGVNSLGGGNSSYDVHDQIFVLNSPQILRGSEFFGHIRKIVDIKLLVLSCPADDQGDGVEEFIFHGRGHCFEVEEIDECVEGVSHLFRAIFSHHRFSENQDELHFLELFEQDREEVGNMDDISCGSVLLEASQIYQT